MTAPYLGEYYICGMCLNHMVIDCMHASCKSHLPSHLMVQYMYAVDLLVLQEKMGMSFFEARIAMCQVRGEKMGKIAAEFG